MLEKGKLRSLVRQKQHLNRPGTPAGAGTGDHNSPESCWKRKDSRNSGACTSTGAAEVRADTRVPVVPPSGCTVHGTWAQACKRRSASRAQLEPLHRASAGPAQGLQFWAWLGPPGEGQRAGHQPSTVAYQQASDGLEGRGQESRSDANPSPNYLKARPPVAVPRGIAWHQHQHHILIILGLSAAPIGLQFLTYHPDSPLLSLQIILPHIHIHITNLILFSSASYLSSLALSPT